MYTVIHFPSCVLGVSFANFCLIRFTCWRWLICFSFVILIFSFFPPIFNLLLFLVFPSLFFFSSNFYAKEPCLLSYQMFHILNFAGLYLYGVILNVSLSPISSTVVARCGSRPDPGLIFGKTTSQMGWCTPMRKHMSSGSHSVGQSLHEILWIQANFTYINYIIFKSYTIFLNSITVQQHLFWFAEGISLF